MEINECVIFWFEQLVMLILWLLFIWLNVDFMGVTDPLLHLWAFMGFHISSCNAALSRTEPELNSCGTAGKNTCMLLAATNVKVFYNHAEPEEKC